MDEAEYRLRLYLSCDSARREECLMDVLAVDRAALLPKISLPHSAEERFRVYDLLTRIAPDCQEMLAHVLEECYDGSDMLNQLAAIQFVFEHKMNDLDNFVQLFDQNLDNPLTIVPIAQTVIAMLVQAPNPIDYIETVAKIVDHATSDSPDLLGALPPLASVEPLARFLLESPPFQMWLFDVPHNPELRTFNVYMRNLLARWSTTPGELLLSARSIAAALTNPSPGLRTAAFEHIALMAANFRDQLLAMERLPERVCDGSMDSTVDEVLARQKAIEALGIRMTIQRTAGVASSAGIGDAGPDLMTI